MKLQEHLYERVARNKRNSYILILAVTALLIVTGFIIGGAAGSVEGGTGAAVIIAIVLTFISVTSGDSILLAVSGAKQIQKPDNPVLFNVVEEMAIASGLPMPQIYIIEDSAPNAFATGRNPKRAQVAVTRGLLDKLSREELQGVIGHEMSHIRHYDILFATLMGVMVGTVALLCDFFMRNFRYSRRRNSNGNSAIFLLLALLLSVLAPLLAGVIQMAMSREREYLADTGSTELTRNPLALAKALEKISNDIEPLEVANRATQHLYIINPLRTPKEEKPSLFDTHPSTKERINILRELAHSLPGREVS